MVDPVAWQVKDYADGWIVFAELRHAKAQASAMGGALIRPLYPTPPPAPAVTREELVDLIDQHVEAQCTYADDLYLCGQEDAADAILSRLAAGQPT